MTDSTNDICDVARILQQAGSILFITGAGISADSGLPTYRGVGGLYNDCDTDDDVAIEDALSGPMFAMRPELTWKYLWQIGAACVGAKPNAAHEEMARLENVGADVWVVTQNVDGLHRAAGSKNLVEVHGHIFDLRCVECGACFSAEELIKEYRVTTTLPPMCRECQGVIRPEVVLFSEMLPSEVVRALEDLATKDFDVVVAVGTSAVFPYIVHPIVQARRCGRPAVEINPCRTTISDVVSHRITLGAAEAMTRIRAEMN
jgi:NAD-dependent deacetylase